ncbi:MAG: PEP-CTERM sorting domain-containing protein [Verrucomicrobia bacterium]|nr:PEP-CTERM sorting domain-containing protein [Verrucomicrobiota bacterium]MCH8511979.1 PEP-CTERM sorting domain-containing protein [Kiritimatiellia bacterium]
MKTRIPLIAAVFLGAAIASASLLVHEPFDYTVDANIGGVAATGTGLTGNWQRTFTDTATAILRTYEATWDTPANYLVTPLNKGVGTPVDQNNSAAVNLATGAQIDFDTDGAVYYSYLLKYGTDNRSRVSFGSSSAPDLMRVQGIANGTLRVYAGGDFSDGAALATDTDYLIVGRITTSELGSDEHRIWVYPSSGTVAGSDPGTAGSYAFHTGTITGNASMLQFSNVIDAQYGEFRMGTTWESVAIPEPSSILLLGSALGLFVLFNRRRIK